MKLAEARSLEEYVYLHYIVRVGDGEDPQEVADEYAATGVEVTDVYKSAINGFSAHLYDFTIEEMRTDERIVRVEEDGLVEEDAVTQYNAPWALDRVDSANPIMNNQYVYKNDGRGVKIYVIDSGVRPDHIEFEDTILTQGYIADPNNPWAAHGTGVASCAAGKRVGVAKRAEIVDISASGTAATRIGGMEWVLNNGEPPHVVCMSFGFLNNSSIYDATANLVAAGFTCIASAGNDPAMNISQRSPQNVPGVLVVGGTRQDDNRYTSTSEGETVDILAPAQNMLIADPDTGNDVYRTGNGTSYGCPMVAGAAAMLIANDPNTTYQQVHNTILSLATPDVITGLINDETPNLLLNIESIDGTIYADDDGPSTSIEVQEVEPPPVEGANAQFNVAESSEVEWQGLTDRAGTFFAAESSLAEWVGLTEGTGTFSVAENSLAEWQSVATAQGQFELLDESLSEWQVLVDRAGEFFVLDETLTDWQALVDHAGEFSASGTTVADWFGGVSGATQFIVFDRTAALWSGATESHSKFELLETSEVEWAPSTTASSSFAVGETSTVDWSVVVESGSSFAVTESSIADWSGASVSGSSFELLDTSTATWDSHIVGTSQYSVIEYTEINWHGYVQAVAEAIFNVTDRTRASFRTSSLVWRNIDIVVGNLRLEFGVGVVAKSYVFPTAPLASFGVGEVRLVPRFIVEDVSASRLIVGNVDIIRLPVSAPAVSISVGTPFV